MYYLTLGLAIASLSLVALVSCSSGATSQSPPTDHPSTYGSTPMAASSSCPFPAQATPGPYAVAEADNLFLRKSNGQQLPLKIYYPQTSGVLPTIIFSHGSGGSKDFYAPLGRFWASHGYISIHPTHGDSLSLNRRSMQELLKYSLHNPQAWEDRVADISLIINSLDKLGQNVPQLQGKIDPRRLGVGGHSFGAYTAQLIGGAKIDIPNGLKGKSFADPRVKALLLLSPQGKGQQGLNAASWNTMTLPIMFMTGTNDTNPTNGQGPAWRREPFDAVPPGDKYLVFIQGANHFSFGGRLTGDNPSGGQQSSASGSLRDKIRERIREQMMQRQLQKHSDPNVDQDAIFEYVKLGSLSFWDAYLKGDSKAKSCLRDKALEAYSHGDVSVSIR